jgi:tetratricopeptide (TPR) repeat protein
MKVVFPLAGLVLLLGAPLWAADFLGADAVLKQAAAEQAKGPPRLTGPGALRARLAAFPARALTLAPEDAAKEWQEMFDQYSDQSHESDKDRGWTPLFFASLPPSSSWDSLAKDIRMERFPGHVGMRGECMDLLMATLSNDPLAEQKALEELRQESKHFDYRNGEKADGLCWVMSMHLERVRVEAQGTEGPVAEFEKELTKGSAFIDTPDLVEIVGAEKAAPLLRRALRLKTTLSLAQNETRRLAVRLALESADKLKAPQWHLIREPEDGPLYEALMKRFPADKSGPRWGEATANYILYLAGTGRTEEASRLTEEADVLSELNKAAVIHPGRREFDRRVRDFFREELSQHPYRLDWKVYVDLSQQLGEPGPMLDFLPEVLARPGLFFRTHWQIRDLYARALLAQDRLEEGARELIAAIREDPRIEKAEASTELPEPRERPERGEFRNPEIDRDVDRCLLLARIGRLAGREDWVRTGTTSALIVLRAATHADVNATIRVADFLTEIGRGSEAERLLVEEQRNLPLGDDSWLGDMCEELAKVYARAGRPADVLKLLDHSPYWYREDLRDYDWTGHINPLLLAAARALAATGKKDEARRAVSYFLERQPDSDPAYELLLQLGGEQLEEQLDTLARSDRFEKRPLIWKAKMQLDQGRLGDAEKNARAAIAMDPSDAQAPAGDRMRAYAVLGDILAKKGDTAEARKMHNVVEAVRLAEQADACHSLGLTTRAARVYEQALEKFADACCIQSRLALCYSELGDGMQAELHYRRAFELMPASVGRIESHCLECERIFQDERGKIVADRVLTELAAREPGNPQAQYLLGVLREDRGRNAEALEQYRKAVKLDPDYLNAWKQLRGMQSRLSQPAKDLEQTELTLLRLDPGLRHHDAKFESVRDLRLLWDAILAAERDAPSSWTGPVYPLRGVAAESGSPGDDGARRIDSLRFFRLLGQQSDFDEELERNKRNGGTARTMSELLRRPLRVAWCRHPMLNALSEYLEGIVFRP